MQDRTFTEEQQNPQGISRERRIEPSGWRGPQRCGFQKTVENSKSEAGCGVAKNERFFPDHVPPGRLDGVPRPQPHLEQGRGRIRATTQSGAKELCDDALDAAGDAEFGWLEVTSDAVTFFVADAGPGLDGTDEEIAEAVLHPPCAHVVQNGAAADPGNARERAAGGRRRGSGRRRPAPGQHPWADADAGTTGRGRADRDRRRRAVGRRGHAGRGHAPGRTCPACSIRERRWAVRLGGRGPKAYRGYALQGEVVVPLV